MRLLADCRRPSGGLGLWRERRIRRVRRRGRSIEIEHGAIMRSPEMNIEPRDQLFTVAHRGDTFVLDRGEDGAANQNLLSRIALSIGLSGASKKTIALRA
jgi:hypothetical protein